MINNKWILVAGILALGAGATLSYDYFTAKKNQQDERVGKTIVEQDKLLSVDTIIGKTGKKEIKLTRDADNNWNTASDGGFPSEAKKVADFLDSIGKVEFQRLVSTDKAKFGEFGIEFPDKPDSPLSDKTIQVRLLSQEKSILTLNLGDARSSGGQYVTVGDEARVFLVDQKISLELESASWELKTLVNVKKEDIASMEFHPPIGSGKSPVKFVWEESPPVKPEDATAAGEKPLAGLKMQGLVSPEKEKAGALSQVETAFADIRFLKRIPMSDPQASQDAAKSQLSAYHAVVTAKDGRSYDLAIGHIEGTTKDDKGKYYVKVLASKNPSTPGDAPVEKGIERLNKLMDQYIFEISSYHAEKLIKAREDFLENPEAMRPTAKKD